LRFLAQRELWHRLLGARRKGKAERACCRSARRDTKLHTVLLHKNRQATRCG
jgi:hypothetical protein